MTDHNPQIEWTQRVDRGEPESGQFRSRAGRLIQAQLLIVILSIPFYYASAASAQNDGTSDATDVDPFAGVEVMEVLGSTEAALLDSANPTSVLTFDTDDLQALGASDVADVATFTPNLEIRKSGSTTAIFFIRGVGLADFSANAASSVAIYIDQVPMNSPALQLGQLFDIQNFSVMKGPQSGGSGRNASAGAIHIQSREPGFETQANLRVGTGTIVSRDAIDAQQYEIEGGIDIPIVEDILTSRLAFTISGEDPFLTNRCGGALPIPASISNPQPGERDPTVPICGEALPGRFGSSASRPRIPAGLPDKVGESLDWGARSIFKLVIPDQNASFVLNVHGRQLREDSTLGQAFGTNTNGNSLVGVTSLGYTDPDISAERRALVNQGIPPTELFSIVEKNIARDRPLDEGPFDGDYNRVGRTRFDSWGASLRAEIDVGDVSIRSVSGFDRYERSRNTDQDFTPDVLFEALTEDNAWQFAQELALESELDSLPLRWEVGGTFLTEDLRSTINQRINAPPPFDRFTRIYTQELYSVGAFGRISYDFLENFTLEAGIRYNWERKIFDIRQFRPGVSAGEQKEQRTWQAPTGAISLTYNMTESVAAYWKYSRGFKAGHFNSNTVFATPAGAEEIDSFEVGIDGSYWENRIVLNAAFFHYAYSDYQVFVFEDEPGRNPTREVINANDARVFGIDAELVVEPLIGLAPEEIEDLEMTVRFGWLDTRFLRFTNLQNRVLNARVIQIVDDNSGNPTINSPRFKVSGSLRWQFLTSGLGSITPRYDFSWTDEIFFDATEGRGGLNAVGERNKPKFTTGQPALWLHNVRIAYRDSAEKIEIAGFCRNVTDERYKTSAFDASAFANVVISFVGRPRTCGAELSLFW